MPTLEYLAEIAILKKENKQLKSDKALFFWCLVLALSGYAYITYLIAYS